MKRARSILAAACGLAAAAAILVAQQTQAPAVKRTVLLKQDATVPGREFVMAMTELPPGATEGRHTHAAELYAYVLEGALTFTVEGQPAKTYKAGDVFTVAPGQIHEGANKGTVPVKVSVVFFAEKGKPLTTPVQ